MDLSLAALSVWAAADATVTAADTARVVFLLLGMTLAMVAVKAAVLAFIQGDNEAGWGAASFGLFALTPVVIALDRFGQPLNLTASLIYAAALGTGAVAASYRLRLQSYAEQWPCSTMRRARARRRLAKRQQEDTDGV